MKIKRFEDIEARQGARNLVKEIYKMTNSAKFNSDWGLIRQIQTACVSILSNIAEGFDSGSKLEFIRFLSYARRSSSEVQSDLYIALDQRYIQNNEFSSLYDKTEKIRRQITALMNYLKGFQRANAPTRKRENAQTTL